MNKTLLIICKIFFCLSGNSQIIAREVMTEKIEGICNDKEVYVIFGSLKGQIEPKCSLTTEEIQNLLNEKVMFLKANPKFKGKGMIGVYINCEGKPLKWEIDGKTKSDELDRQLLDIFKTLENWTAGKLNGNTVDARVLISYKIKNGTIVVE